MLIKDIQYNIAQLAFTSSYDLPLAKTWVLEWGRGTGKSTIIGRHLLECITQMPRSTGAIVGSTFIQIKTRTLPSTIAGLEEHDIYQNVHYVIGKYPPKEWKWPTAYQAVLDPSNAIFWWNGSVTVFLSLDAGSSSGRGLNLDYVIGDEAALFPKEKYDTDVKLTIRGNLKRKANYPDGTWKYFKDCPLHHSELLATSTPITSEGQWIFEYDELADDPKNGVVYIKATAVVNLENLGKNYFANAKKTLLDFIYDAEMLCKRITQIKDGFYPRFNADRHTYTMYDNEYYQNLAINVEPTCQGDTDRHPDMALHLSIDWGANINCLVVAQKYPDELRLLKNHYVLSPKILDDVIAEEFIPYYEPHKSTCNKIYLWYDPSGNVKQANSRKTYAEQAADILKIAGWSVQFMVRNQYNELHEKKFQLCTELFGEEKLKYPRIRFNKSNCKELIKSIELAPAKKGTKVKIQKDKKSERNKKIPQQHATHFSDAFDVLIVGLYMRLIHKIDASIEATVL